MISPREHLQDARVVEYREARAAVDAGLSAPPGSHERYRVALGPYVIATAEYIGSHDNAAFLRPIMMETLFDLGIPFGVIAIGFRANDAELARIRERPPPVPAPVDEIERLQRMPYGLYLKTPHWQRVRAEALKRAEYRCQVCGNTEFLQVHHRDYTRRGCERPADVTVLCDTHHKVFHEYEKAARRA